jgi:hypothetical protein
MYGWATPERLLDEMTLDQVLLYHSRGWEARKSQALVFFGVLGQILQGEDPEKAAVKGIDEYKKANPGETLEGGAYRYSV